MNKIIGWWHRRNALKAWSNGEPNFYKHQLTTVRKYYVSNWIEWLSDGTISLNTANEQFVNLTPAHLVFLEDESFWLSVFKQKNGSAHWIYIAAQAAQVGNLSVLDALSSVQGKFATLNSFLTAPYFHPRVIRWAFENGANHEDVKKKRWTIVRPYASMWSDASWHYPDSHTDSGMSTIVELTEQWLSLPDDCIEEYTGFDVLRDCAIILKSHIAQGTGFNGDAAYQSAEQMFKMVCTRFKLKLNIVKVLLGVTLKEEETDALTYAVEAYLHTREYFRFYRDRYKIQAIVPSRLEHLMEKKDVALSMFLGFKEEEHFNALTIYNTIREFHTLTEQQIHVLPLPGLDASTQPGVLC